MLGLRWHLRDGTTRLSFVGIVGVCRRIQGANDGVHGLALYTKRESDM